MPDATTIGFALKATTDTVTTNGLADKSPSQLARNVVSLSIATAKVASDGASQIGPVGLAVSASIDVAINGLHADGDLGVTQSCIAELMELQDSLPLEKKETKTARILAWYINKLKRRTHYDRMESGGARDLTKKLREGGKFLSEMPTSVPNSGHTKAVASVAVGSAWLAGGASVIVGAALGQIGSKMIRTGRGFLKSTGVMGSERQKNTEFLYAEYDKGCPVASKLLLILLHKGGTNMRMSHSEARMMIEKKKTQLLIKELAKTSSTYKNT